MLELHVHDSRECSATLTLPRVWSCKSPCAHYKQDAAFASYAYLSRINVIVLINII